MVIKCEFAARSYNMEVLFDCFFDETFARLERSGLHTRQKRRDVIDHLNAIILGSSKGKCVCALCVVGCAPFQLLFLG